MKREFSLKNIFILLMKQVEDFHNQEIYKNFENGVIHKKPKFKIFILVFNLMSRTLFGNCVMIAFVMIFHSGFRTPNNTVEIFGFGTTRNNQIAFNRIHRCLEPMKNIKFDSKGKKVKKYHRLKSILCSQNLVDVGAILKNISTMRPLPRMQAVIAAAAFLFYYDKNFWSEIKVLCVASDHNPISQALLILSKVYNVKTCYIQHAPVSSYFPPLDYDLSILNDRRSLQHYKKVALVRKIKNSGQVKFLSPFDKKYNKIKSIKNPVVVGLCLSFILKLKSIENLIKDLEDLDEVSSVLIRRHPRCNANLKTLEKYSKVNIRAQNEDLSNYLKDIDVLLVPTSGVAIEALHQGIPTFFVDGIDNQPYDYYGFIGDKILHELNLKTFRSFADAVNFYDKDWLNKFSDYDETVNTSIEESESIIRNSLIDLLEKGS